MSATTTTHLKLIKEYIDAKAEYEEAGFHRRTDCEFAPSSTLTPKGIAIRDRYLTAEQALNQAIDIEQFELPERRKRP